MVKSVCTPIRLSQDRTASAENSGLLSEQMCCGTPSVHKEFREAVEHVIGSQLSFNIDGQTFSRIFVHNGEELHRSPHPRSVSP